jgi:hypothetical protein
MANVVEPATSTNAVKRIAERRLPRVDGAIGDCCAADGAAADFKGTDCGGEVLDLTRFTAFTRC